MSGDIAVAGHGARFPRVMHAAPIAADGAGADGSADRHGVGGCALRGRADVEMD
jgi:hypothetical protein